MTKTIRAGSLSARATGPDEPTSPDITSIKKNLRLHAVRLQREPHLGFSGGPRIARDLACNALCHAITACSRAGVVVYTDRGSQSFQGNGDDSASLDMRELRARSHSQTFGGTCMHSSPCYKKGLDHQIWVNREYFRIAIVTTIELDHFR